MELISVYRQYSNIYKKTEKHNEQKKHEITKIRWIKKNQLLYGQVKSTSNVLTYKNHVKFLPIYDSKLSHSVKIK